MRRESYWHGYLLVQSDQELLWRERGCFCEGKYPRIYSEFMAVFEFENVFTALPKDNTTRRLKAG